VLDHACIPVRPRTLRHILASKALAPCFCATGTGGGASTGTFTSA
jgi:hypothetical protein